MELRGARFLITGASRGIGRSLALLLAREGAALHLVARSKDALAEVAAVCARSGARVGVTVADVGLPAERARIVQDALALHGHIDVLVNNAAILAEPRPVLQTPLDDWEAVLRTNVLGCVGLIQGVVPGMLERGKGAVVNLSSGWGRVANADVASYCASKFAIEALTQSLAEELAGTGVSVIALNPGVIRTDMLRRAWSEMADQSPGPESLDRCWSQLLRELGPALSGRSLDLLDYA